ncbi:G-protein alpha subunit [Multifurca ochricompacta]|uniref:G-protein alpha subunit n=1 Tax=Multifurca ochricompacta TaxID=376703 RepID=A0AAD4QQS3_9AGAM|nr:G-protein alpha subunit [Multifurca ochricompacta]
MPGVVENDQARRVSKAIDDDIKREREQIKKRQKQRKDVKVMLLGQAESGKSTLQKQFQLYHASQTLDRERPSWRPIVYFNAIKAVRTILDELDWDFTTHANREDEAYLDPNWPAQISRIRHKLLPLITIEDSLASELSSGVTVAGGRSGVFVRAGWQSVVTSTRSWPVADMHGGNSSGQGVVANMAARLLAELQYDAAELWQHPAVKTLLRMRRLRLDESAAFFLDEVHRISEPDYLPTTDDILHVRLQTLGVTEHSFDINFGGNHYTWILYDVGGARHAWVPYFDDATAIIFLAPISAFDQYLEEDPRTNRIDDSLQLFTSTCSNKLLKNSSMVLMLNKTDLLKKKLQAGVMVKKYITSYGERENRYEDVAEYFRAHFAQVHKRKGVQKQELYIHFTSMLDVRATQRIIVDINEAIIKSYLGQSMLVS